MNGKGRDKENETSNEFLFFSVSLNLVPFELCFSRILNINQKLENPTEKATARDNEWFHCGNEAFIIFGI